MIFVRTRKLCAEYGFQLSIGVKLQIMEINFENKAKVAGDKIIHFKASIDRTKDTDFIRIE